MIHVTVVILEKHLQYVTDGSLASLVAHLESHGVAGKVLYLVGDATGLAADVVRELRRGGRDA